MNISFKGVDNEEVKKCFLQVLSKYESLHKYPIILKQRAIKSSTMQAQPILSLRSILGVKQYQVKLAIYVRDSQSLKVDNLPEDVLIGWFAHELGHVVDYERYNLFQMLSYGLKYMFSDSFKKDAEHAADRIAMENGFKEHILITKRYILEHELLAEGYKDKIRKYYMPIEDVEAWEHTIIPGVPEAKL